MAKRIIVDVTEDYPSLTADQLKKLVENITFAVDAFLDINEYTMKVVEE